jgi:hypothetical protein
MSRPLNANGTSRSAASQLASIARSMNERVVRSGSGEVITPTIPFPGQQWAIEASQ